MPNINIKGHLVQEFCAEIDNRHTHRTIDCFNWTTTVVGKCGTITASKLKTGQTMLTIDSWQFPLQHFYMKYRGLLISDVPSYRLLRQRTQSNAMSVRQASDNMLLQTKRHVFLVCCGHVRNAYAYNRGRFIRGRASPTFVSAAVYFDNAAFHV